MIDKMNPILIILFLILLLPVYFVKAQEQSSSPRELLKQMVAELQQNPNNQKLREKIIRLVITFKPPPAISEETEKYEGAGEYAYKHAKNESDFAKAAKEYEKALLIAPWVAIDYYNCGVAYEKAGNLQTSKRNYELYLIAEPNAQDASDVRKRIGGFEYAIENAEKEKLHQMEVAHLEEEKKQMVERVLREFERDVDSKLYERWVATYDKMDRSGHLGLIGVNAAEFHENWWGWPAGVAGAKYVFSSNGEVHLCFIADDGDVDTKNPILRGNPVGQTIQDIVWYDNKGEKVWVYRLENNGSIIYGPGPPEETIRKTYWWYRLH